MNEFDKNFGGDFEEDFEFKPLTKGLGFHKKTVEISLDKARTIQEPTITKTLPRQEFASPLSANATVSSNPIPRAVAPQPEPLLPTFKSPYGNTNSIPSNRSNLDFFDTPAVKPPATTSTVSATAAATLTKPATQIQNSSIRIQPQTILEPVSFSVPAAIFDLLVICGLVCLFTGVVLAVTQSDITLVLENANSDVATRASLVVLVLAVIQLYMTLSRSFFGRTIGDWAFEQRLGDEEQLYTNSYPVKVFARGLAQILTGFVTLPILSLIFRRDIAYYLSGVRLFRNKA